MIVYHNKFINHLYVFEFDRIFEDAKGKYNQFDVQLVEHEDTSNLLVDIEFPQDDATKYEEVWNGERWISSNTAEPTITISRSFNSVFKFFLKIIVDSMMIWNWILDEKKCQWNWKLSMWKLFVCNKTLMRHFWSKNGSREDNCIYKLGKVSWHIHFYKF